MISLKRLKQHWTAGPLACLLSAALSLPVLLAWLLAAPRPAHAQTLNRLPTWAVVTFVNSTGYGGNEVGIEASDGFVVELGKSNKYDVLPRAQTEQSIADLGLVEPLDTIGLQKLARSMEADAVATGEVASVSFPQQPAPRHRHPDRQGRGPHLRGTHQRRRRQGHLHAPAHRRPATTTRSSTRPSRTPTSRRSARSAPSTCPAPPC